MEKYYLIKIKKRQFLQDKAVLGLVTTFSLKNNNYDQFKCSTAAGNWVFFVFNISEDENFDDANQTLPP